MRPILRVGATSLVLAALVWEPEDDDVVGAIAFLSRQSGVSGSDGSSAAWAPVAYRALVLTQRLYEGVIVAPFQATGRLLAAWVPPIGGLFLSTSAATAASRRFDFDSTRAVLAPPRPAQADPHRTAAAACPTAAAAAAAAAPGCCR